MSRLRSLAVALAIVAFCCGGLSEANPKISEWSSIAANERHLTAAAAQSNAIFSVTPSNCTVTPNPTEEDASRAPPPPYFTVFCPPAIEQALVHFPAKRADGKVVLQNGAPVLSTLKAASTQHFTGFQLCKNQTDPMSCAQFEIRVGFSNYEKPVLDAIDVLGSPLPQADFDPQAENYTIQAFANVPTTILIRANYRNQILVGGLNKTATQGFVESTLSFVYRPKAQPGGPPDLVKIYAATRDATVIRTYTLIVKTVASQEARLASLSISPGRLEPRFESSVYSYFARVPPGRTSYAIHLEALDNVHTTCHVNGQETIISGQGDLTVQTTELQGGKSRSIILECTAQDQTHTVRYILVLVQQLGGSTLLNDMDIVGTELDQPFDPLNHGPYIANLATGKGRNTGGWIAFRGHSTNPRAIISVDRRPIDTSSGQSAWFKVDLGTNRQFRIGVRTPENPVEETYYVIVKRQAKWYESIQRAHGLSSWLGALSTIASADTAATFLQNFRFLQFMSLTGRIHQTPEAYGSFSGGLNPWNFQFYAPGIAMLKNRDSIAHQQYNFTMPPEQYPELVSDLRPSAIPLSHEAAAANHPQEESHADQTSSAVTETLTYMATNFLEPHPSEGGSWVSVFDGHGQDAKLQKAAEAVQEKLKHRNVVDTSKFSMASVEHAVGAESYAVARRLTVLTDEEQLHILESINSDFMRERAICDYMTSIVLITMILVVIAVGYFGAVTLVVNYGIKDTSHRIRDMPVILHPVRFWTFVFDVALMAYAQACIGILSCPSDLRHAEFIVLKFIKTSPLATMWFAALVLLLFPIGYLLAVAWALWSVRQNVVFSNELARYHKKDIFIAKAESRLVPWLPIISSLLAIEIRDVAPIFAPDDSFEEEDQVDRQPVRFSEDTSTGGPCLADVPEFGAAVLDSETLGRNKPAELQYQMLEPSSRPGSGEQHIHYHPESDELKVSLGGLRGSYMYDGNNTPVYDKYPGAILGRKTLRVLNPNSYGMNCHVNIQLKHLSNLWQMSELPHHFHFWIPRRNCHMHELDGWGTLLHLSQRGNYYYYLIDRLAYLLLMAGIVVGQDSRGVLTSYLVAAACLLMAVGYAPAAIATGTSKWYRLMAQECRDKKKEALFEVIEKKREEKWPYTEDSLIRDRVEQLQLKKEAMDPCGHGGWFVRHPDCGYSDLSLWHHRLWLCVREVLLGAPGLELTKFFVVLCIAMGNMTRSMLSAGASTHLAIFFSYLGALCINYDSLRHLAKQCYTLLVASSRHGRQALFWLHDSCKDLSHIGGRLQHLFKTLWKRLNGEWYASNDYPVNAGETIREFHVDTCSLIADEVGIVFEGTLKPDDVTARLARKVASRHEGRYGLYKTLYLTGPLGARRQGLDHSLPIRLPFRDFYLGKESQTRGVCATIHIVNHGFRSTLTDGKCKNLFGAEDDSYLSLYRDPHFMPEWGNLRVNPTGHGYVVHFDRESRSLIFRGPAIKPQTRYYVRSAPHIARENDEPSVDASDDADLDTVRTESAGDSASETHYQARSTCAVPGLLYVSVPPSRPPCIWERISVESCCNSSVSFTINPDEVKVYYDKACRELVLRHRLFRDTPGNNEYFVTWTIARNEQPINEVAICEDRGVLYVPLSNPGLPDLKTMITLTDDEEKAIVVDPRDTDAHRVSMPKSKEARGPALVLSQLLGACKGWVSQLRGDRPLRDTVEDYVPCTVVQCVNPVLGHYRIEPNFRDVMRTLRAQMHCLEAQRADLKVSGRVMWSTLMSRREVDAFWRQHGVNTSAADGVWVDPLENSDHPLVRSQAKKIEPLIPRFRQLVETLLLERIKEQEASLKTVAQWVRAYDDPNLYAAQLDRDAIELTGTAEALESHIQKVKSYKSQYDSSIPQFFYPFVVEECMISKIPNVSAQLRQWQRQLGVWLRTEEDAMISTTSTYGSSRSALSSSTSRESETFSLERTMADIMRALKDNINREECLESGQHRTVLHYVTDSLNVRGPYTNWRPDPIGGHLALVRIWYPDADGNPDFSREPVWNPCCLKLSGTALKILLPGKDDVEFRFRTPYYWSHVLGHAVQLDCLEMLEVSRQYTLPAGHTSNAMLRGMPGQLVCRLTSVLQHVGDKHIRLVESGVSGKEILMKHDGGVDGNPQGDDGSAGNSTDGESFVVSLGRRVPTDEAGRYPQPEVRIANGHAQVFPLTFRFAERFVDKWAAVVESAQMNKPPLDVDLGFGLDSEMGVTEEEEPSAADALSDGLPSPSSASTPEPNVDYRAEYAGEWQNYQYHGRGELRDANGEVVYSGDWKYGHRWGYGECRVVDAQGKRWLYRGQFVKDEISGDGELVLVDKDELERLKKSPRPEDKLRVVHYKGRFRPANSQAVAAVTEPLESSRPNIDPELLRELFETDPNYNLTQKPLVIDIRRAISVDVLEVTPHEATAASSTREAIKAEYLPHRTRWSRSMGSGEGDFSCREHLPYGTIHFADGAVYEGDLKNGLPSGRGCYMSYDKKVKCEGSFLEGNPHGYAVLLEIKEDGSESMYHGDFKKGLRHGHGVQTSKNGKIFAEGDWKDDRLVDSAASLLDTDPSAVTDPKGLQRYVGAIKDGLPDGDGKITWKDKMVYKGSFSKGKRHGHGVIRDASGKVLLSGPWANDVPSGRVARLVFPDGKVYTGEMVDGDRKGIGELFYSEKGEPLYEGLWDKGKPHGRGILYGKDGTYDGEFKDGQRHGKGSFEFNDHPGPKGKNRTYIGDWRNDLPHGVGLYTNDLGISNTYKFTKGVLNKESVKAYKSGMCGKAPAIGSEPTVRAAGLDAPQPETFGPQRTLSREAFNTLAGPEATIDLWPRLTRFSGSGKKESYVSSEAAPEKPEPIDRDLPVRRRSDESVTASAKGVPDFQTESPVRQRGLCFTVLHGTGFQNLAKDFTFMVSAIIGQEAQKTSTLAAAKDTVTWNTPLTYPLRREREIYVELWRKDPSAKETLVATGKYDLEAFLTRNIRESGAITISLSLVPKSDVPETVKLSLVASLSIVERSGSSKKAASTSKKDLLATTSEPAAAAAPTPSPPASSADSSMSHSAKQAQPAERAPTKDNKAVSSTGAGQPDLKDTTTTTSSSASPKQQNHVSKKSEKRSDGTAPAVQPPCVRIYLDSAKDLPNMDVGKKMDPYVVVSAGSTKVKSKVQTRAGKNPVFEEELLLPYEGQDTLLVELYDKDLLSSDDLIGSVTINLKKTSAKVETFQLSRVDKKGLVLTGTLRASVQLVLE